ncbi:condensation domain-containing protein [Brevibacillus parabrevis]|uniref:condensation domain-containing protein n=1 Tax=Brevibacillus parabrevis TaxID=54914 RepID=UPI002E211A6F|nr:condensation domain-containing protein [Brevibacillus parabrevis]MED1724560.1 condensation domain-containing protein [Brevibacillus parabrevis]
MSQHTALYPLTHPQKRIWYIEMIYPGISLHNIGGIVWIKGTVDLERLEDAIHLFVERNEGIRLQLGVQGEKPFQYVGDYHRSSLKVLDFSGEDDRVAAAKAWAEAAFSQPFTLLAQPLFELVLLQLNDQKKRLFRQTSSSGGRRLEHSRHDGADSYLLRDEFARGIK